MNVFRRLQLWAGRNWLTLIVPLVISFASGIVCPTIVKWISGDEDKSSKTTVNNYGLQISGINVQGANGVTIKDNKIHDIGQTAPEVHDLPGVDTVGLNLSDLNTKIFEADLPHLTDSTSGIILSYVDSLTAATKIGKNVVLAIDKKSNGIIGFYQLSDNLKRHGYNVLQVGFVNID